MITNGKLYLRIIYIISICISLVACQTIAVQMTPKKKAMVSQTPLSIQAENFFWQTLHEGNYAGLNKTEYLLTAAYLDNPNDPSLAAHLGFVHIWKITERARKQPISPTIVNEIILAKKYFADAVELQPNDARFLGFYGDTQLISGDIFKDDREKTRGYFTLKKAIKHWPEFNYFTAGYPMSTLPAESTYFKRALSWQWETLDLCAGQKVSRIDPDFSAYMKLETQKGSQRACWNSWIAPYNFEGFFLNMGDMLVKAGAWQQAIRIYQNATLDSHYSSWPYRFILEEHLKKAKENVIDFQNNEIKSAGKTMMFNSGFGCVVCHQQS